MVITLLKGERVVEAGDVVSEQAVLALQSLGLVGTRATWRIWLGVFLVVLFELLVGAMYLYRFGGKIRADNNLVLVMATLFLLFAGHRTASGHPPAFALHHPAGRLGYDGYHHLQCTDRAPAGGARGAQRGHDHGDGPGFRHRGATRGGVLALPGVPPHPAVSAGVERAMGHDSGGLLCVRGGHPAGDRVSWRVPVIAVGARQRPAQHGAHPGSPRGVRDRVQPLHTPPASRAGQPRAAAPAQAHAGGSRAPTTTAS